MNRNENEAESFAGNFMAFGEEALFFEVPRNKVGEEPRGPGANLRNGTVPKDGRYHRGKNAHVDEGSQGAGRPYDALAVQKLPGAERSA